MTNNLLAEAMRSTDTQIEYIHSKEYVQDDIQKFNLPASRRKEGVL